MTGGGGLQAREETTLKPEGAEIPQTKAARVFGVKSGE